MSYTPQHIQPWLTQFPESKTFWVAFSGGSDSHVLLHSLAELRSAFNADLKAIHINHGLSSLANEWEMHCQNVCDELGVTYQAVKVNAQKPGASPEAAAREARYAQWKTIIDENDVLFLAHHRDDQAETILLQLFRGAGVKGLSAMPGIQSFARGKLCRPLLAFSREELTAYADTAGLHWIDDPSNFDTDFDRNFLRHEVIPMLETRWPGLKKTLSRSAGHQAEASQLLYELAARDYGLVQSDEKNQLKISELLKLPSERQRNLLRYWIAEINGHLLPGSVQLQRIFNELIPASVDANPIVEWGNVEVRRFQDCLYIIRPAEPINSEKFYLWKDFSVPLELNENTRLGAAQVKGQGISPVILGGKEVTVRFRQGGESCRFPGRGNTQELKKLFQQWQVPPWQRNRVPLVYIGDELAQVVGYGTCEPFACKDDEYGWIASLLE